MLRARTAIVATVLAIVPVIGAAPALADDDLAGQGVIFQHGAALVKTDARGKGETELAKLPAKQTVRALRTDAGGKVLLADVGGAWSWMPLDGSTKALSDLPCADGPAQLAEDGACVLCRAKKGGSIIVNLASGKTFPVDVPAPGARLAATGADRLLVWADKTGVWTAPPGDPKKATKVSPDAPLRGFLPSPDGKRAVGVYADEVYDSVKHKKPAEVLMDFQLDGEGARRKAIKSGVPVEWSHDSQWVLVQDGASACIMRAAGGQYKCWRGYTAVSIAPDGKYAFLLGNRDGSKKQTPARGKGKTKDKGKGKGVQADKAPPAPPVAAPAPPPDEPDAEPVTEEGDGGDAGEPPPADVLVALPTGPLALYRAQLEGAFTTSPALVTKTIDGAAVWVPKP